MKSNIVAVVGMCGSGKSVASDLLEARGYKKVYFGGVTMDKLKEEGLEVNPKNERMMRERLRKEHGMGAFAKILLPKIREYANNGDVVLDGLYSWDELKILKEEFNDDLSVIGIIVDRNIRYERLSKRDFRPLTKAEAIKRDLTEIENIAKAGPIAYADYYIDNNSGLESYENRLNSILNKIRGE